MRTSVLGMLAATALLACLILGLTAAYVSKQIASAPAELAERSGAALAEIAAAFAENRVEMRFASDAVEIAGTEYLQVATIEQTEIFERTDSSTLLWGALPLPDVVVEARAIVVYTYYLDLQESWTFDLQRGVAFVTAPPLHFNEPAIDASRIDFQVQQDSLIRDSDEVMDDLRLLLTDLARQRAESKIDLVRDTARREVESFVRTWLLRDHPEARQLRIDVRFADEGGRGIAAERAHP